MSCANVEIPKSDPLVDSTSILPSLPSIFASSHHIAAVASLNYRLSPHPRHPTHPSGPEISQGRTAKWPDHINDVRDAIYWLRKDGGLVEGQEWIVSGHSVGGTMAMMLGMDSMSTREQDKNWPGGIWGAEGGDGSVEGVLSLEGLRAVVSIEGIYDFTACRDTHMHLRDMYEDFTTGAFGPKWANWDRGDILRCGRSVRGGVEVVVGHSKEDELVEWEQAEKLMEVLRRRRSPWPWGPELVELQGEHQEVVRGGIGVGKCVSAAVELLIANEEEKEKKPMSEQVEVFATCI